jgi:hypothetical protein
MDQWIPINMDVEPGAFVLPLVDFAAAGELAKLPTPPKASVMDGEAGAEDTSVDAAFSVGLFGLVSAETKTHWETRAWDYVRSADVHAAPQTGKDYQVRWGFGSRFHVQYTTVDASVTVDTPLQIAGAADLQLTRTAYAVEMFGLATPAALGWLPAPGAFGADAWKKIDAGMRGSLVDVLNDPDRDTKVHPLPIAVKFDGSYAGLAVDKAVSIAFAIRSIAADRARSAALAAAAGKAHILAAEVARVYDLWRAAGAVTSDDFKLAKLTAQAWLDDRTDQVAMSRTVARRYPLTVPVSEDGAGLLGGDYLDRIVLRSQALSTDAATKMGFGSIASANVKGSASLLLYELLLRQGLTSTLVNDGVSIGTAKYAGLRLATSLQNVATSIQANFAMVAASASLNLSKAQFRLFDWGFNPQVPAGILVDTKFESTSFPEILAAVEAAKQKVAANPALITPRPKDDIVCGADFVEQSFPGARLIYYGLDRLRRAKNLSTASATAASFHMEKSHMGALYAYFWRDVQPAQEPPDDVQATAAKLFAFTEPV